MRVVRESFTVAGSQPVATLTALVLAAAACAGIILTRGATIAQQEQALARFDTSGGRIVTLTDNSGEGQLDSRSVARLGGVGDVDWVIGLGDARDVENAAVPGGPLITARPITGTAPHLDFAAVGDESDTTSGAFVNARAVGTLGLAQVGGAIRYADGYTSPIVGTYRVTDTGADVGADILIRDPDWRGPVRRISIGVTTAEAVPTVADLTTAVTGGADLGALIVTEPTDLLRLRTITSADNERFGRQMVIGVLAAGVAANALVVYFAVTSRRKDFGRRRALGATRSQLTSLVVIQFLAPSTIGAAAGLAVAHRVLVARYGHAPETSFYVAVAFLVVASGVVVSILPASVAAHRDPVQVLRSP